MVCEKVNVIICNLNYKTTPFPFNVLYKFESSYRDESKSTDHKNLLICCFL